MTRSLCFCLVVILLAAGVSRAAPPTPEALARLSASGDLPLFLSEPCATSPPTALLNSLSSRLETTTSVHLNMVVLLAEFSDRRANALSTPAHFDSILFSRGVFPTGSLADYLAENSNGRFILDGVVKGWYMMPRTYDNYVMGIAGRGQYPYNTQGLAEDAIKLADPDVNYALFDNDGPDGVPDTFDDDQQVDLILVIHAGSGGESAGSRLNLQSVAWWLPSLMPVDGVYAQPFATAPEDGTVGVYGHESLHLLGLPDLYDATGSSFGLGTWTIMAGGWALDQGRTPAHLDSWCKARLGFITPIPVTSTVDDAVFDPVEQGGAVYRLQAYGQTTGHEYFLVENREKVGFDSFLPGAGLLIYHVNEFNPSNNVPGHYTVSLEQADGLFQLENFYGNSSFGDDGDPYTEATPSGGFGRFTVPDSRDQNGDETGVAVYQIRGPDASHRILANLRAVKGPIVRLDSLTIVPVGGNGDAFLNAGESFKVVPALTVSGGTAHDVTIQVTGTDALATIPPMPVHLGDLAQAAGDYAIEIGTASAVPTDPYPVNLKVRIDYADELPVMRDLTAGIGETRGLYDDFEHGITLTHHAVRPNFYDLWGLVASGGSVGPRAWHCGLAGGGMFAGADAVLETPVFIVPADGMLRFDQMVEFPKLDSVLVVAGGFVELSVAGGPWTEITPTRGYDAQFFSAIKDLNGRFIFTGDVSGANPPAWEGVSFPLPAPAGSAAVVRFRCFATAGFNTGMGWWIDNLRVESSSTPVRLSSFSAVHVESGVQLEWKLSGEEDLSGVLVSRSPAGLDNFVPMGGLMAATSRGMLVDAEPLENAAVYRLDAVSRDGSRIDLGRIVVEPESAIRAGLSVSASPNPARGPVAFLLSLGAAGPVHLTVFDAAGRVVRKIVSSRLDAGEYRFEWDNRDDGGRIVPAGVYFYKVESSGSDAPGGRARKLVVIR